MYLLLRNNKQSGPYSFEELKSMGLKAYDLVWSEGKSAAWRYPCEIEELKPFAPAVEEQPFDRFYKRASSSTTTTTASGATLSVKPPAADSPVPINIESSKTPGKRIIYVTMPAARNTSIISGAQREPARETSQPARETAYVTRETAQPARENTQPVREPQQSVYTGTRVIEDYATQQIGDQVMTEEFSPRRKRSPQVVRLLAIGIGIVALLAAGIIIGLNLNKASLGFPTQVVAKLPPANPDQSIVHPTGQTLPASAATTPAITTAQTKPADTVATIVEKPAVTRPLVVKTTPRTPGGKIQKEKPAHSISQANSLPATKDSAADESLVTRAVHRADVAEPHHDNTELADKEAMKTALASQVSVGANGYSVGTFGGITDLQLTVTNRSVYPLDLVIVEVRYIQANKKVFKTENLYFRSIGAGSAMMLEAPKSSRGVRIQYKVTTITTKELGLSYSGI
jgi:hypothetical protein